MYYCFLTKSWWNRLFNPEVTCILYLFDLFTLMNKWRVLTERRNYVGENCNEKKRHLFYFRIETPSGSFFFLPSSLCRREIERRGERRRPQVTFLDYQLNAWGEWERKKEREWRRREVGIGWGKGKGVEKRSDVFISFRLCLVAAGSGFSPHLVAHCLVTEKCVKTPPTTSWRPREREQGRLS